MSKLFKDIEKMKHQIIIIEQYNNFRQLGMEDDISFLKGKIENLYNIYDSEKLIENFKWCANIVNDLYYKVDKEFIKKIQ